MSYKLTAKDTEELENLNEAVSQAISKRKKWLDTMTVKCADVKIGEKLYDVTTGRVLGVVSDIYRPTPNDLYDTTVSVHYRYETSRNCFNNTSSQPGLYVGSKQQAIDYAASRLKALSE
jgi:hypothetical protein